MPSSSASLTRASEPRNRVLNWATTFLLIVQLSLAVYVFYAGVFWIYDCG